jgi:hypothetical protein
MAYRFKKHYTLAEARAMLPKITEWLNDLFRLQIEHDKLSKRVSNLVSTQSDVGGESVNNSLKVLFAMQSIYEAFKKHEIQLKDVERGLIDFPSRRGTREVFLCWQKGEEDIGHWHELDAGFAGREPL